MDKSDKMAEPTPDSTLVTPSMRDLKRFGVGTVVYTLMIGGGVAFVKMVEALVDLL